MTACVVVAACPVVAAWRTTGSDAVFPANSIHAASPSPLRWLLVLSWPTSKPPEPCTHMAGLSSRQQVSYAHDLEAPRISKSFPLGTFVQPSLDTGWIQLVGHDFFHRQGMAHRSSSTYTARCASTEWFPTGQIRLDRASLKANPLQVVALGKNHEILSVTKQRDVSPFVFAPTQIELLRSRRWSSATCSSLLSSMSPRCLWFHTCQASFTNNRKLIGSVLDYFACTSWTSCFSSSFYSPRGRCTEHVVKKYSCFNLKNRVRLMMSQISFRWESRTLLGNTARQELASSLAAFP